MYFPSNGGLNENNYIDKNWYISLLLESQVNYKYNIFLKFIRIIISDKSSHFMYYYHIYERISMEEYILPIKTRVRYIRWIFFKLNDFDIN